MKMHETHERVSAHVAPGGNGETPDTPNHHLTPSESLDLLYAVIEGAGSYLNAYTDADGGRLASALRSTFRIVERVSKEY